MCARLLVGGGGSNGNTRYDNELSGGGESSFLKRPPPKSTLMDYMTSLKISHEIKPVSNDENEKSKDRPESKRRTDDSFHPPNKNHQEASTMNSFTTNHANPDGSDHIVFQQTGISDSFDSEDDPSQSGYRERRNPLPPRLVFATLFFLSQQASESVQGRRESWDCTLSKQWHEMSAPGRKFEAHRNIIIIKRIAPWFPFLAHIGSFRVHPDLVIIFFFFTP